MAKMAILEFLDFPKLISRKNEWQKNPEIFTLCILTLLSIGFEWRETCSGIRPNFCFFHKKNMEVEDHPSIYLTLIESIIHGGQVLLLVWAKHISIFILEGITCYLDFQNHFFSESSIIMIQKCNMYLWYVMHMKRWYK